MTRVLWGMPVALALVISSVATAQEIEVEEQPIQEQPMTQPAQQQQQQQPAQQPTQPAYEQETQPAEAQPPPQQQQMATTTQLQLNQLPQAVRSAVQSEVQDGRIEDIEQDREQGRTVYELEYERGGLEYEVDFAEDGRVLEKHQD